MPPEKEQNCSWLRTTHLDHRKWDQKEVTGELTLRGWLLTFAVVQYSHRVWRFFLPGIHKCTEVHIGQILLQIPPQAQELIYVLEHLFLYVNMKFFKDFIYIFLERGEGRERGRETAMSERNRNISRLTLAHLRPVTRPTTQARALTGNWTSDFLVCRMAPNPLSHSSQGEIFPIGLAQEASKIKIKNKYWKCRCSNTDKFRR